MREPSPRADPEARHVAVWLAPWRALLARRQAERFRLEAAEAAAAQAAHARLERRTALGIKGLPESIATDIRALIPPLRSPLLRLLALPARRSRACDAFNAVWSSLRSHVVVRVDIESDSRHQLVSPPPTPPLALPGLLLPPCFLCPITMELFVDPVVASDGHT